MTTAAGVCAVVDLFAHGQIKGRGLVRQEEVALDAFLDNRFGKNYRGSKIYSRFVGLGDQGDQGHAGPD